MCLPLLLHFNQQSRKWRRTHPFPHKSFPTGQERRNNQSPHQSSHAHTVHSHIQRENTQNTFLTVKATIGRTHTETQTLPHCAPETAQRTLKNKLLRVGHSPMTAAERAAAWTLWTVRAKLSTSRSKTAAHSWGDSFSCSFDVLPPLRPCIRTF